ncbi:hypothetical protein AQUCO_04900178v1 [Aquilegia coerulea]|uniref:Cupin type-1 domain-containing protein n=1 Tax=Aquilegia coerulea TaxID=218851 RepID=A0A2G5CK93_AQUCA|nr:hypothetical protein AQUCO_04900178v1 [Aquilegia coerulea]
MSTNCRKKPGQQQQCQEFCEEYRQCQQECRQQPGQAQQQCLLQCVERYSKEQQDGGIRLITEEGRDPQREYQQCQQDCRIKPGQQQQQCQEFCEEYRQCQQECRQQPGQAQQQCLLQCVERYSREQQDDDAHLDNKNPEKKYQKCQKKCGKKQGQEQQQCQQQCEEIYHKKQETGGDSGREQETAGGSGTEQETAGGSDMLNVRETQDPQSEFQQCQRQCRQKQQGQEQQQRCMEQCKKELEERQREQGSGEGQKGYEGEAGQHGGEEAENPYLFRQERFSSHVRSEEGNVRVLERFNMRSNLLNGIENYRVAILETNPNSVEIPNHWDADTVCFVIRGRGAITLIQEENNKVTHNLERGDIIRVRGGTIVSMINRDNNEKLYVVTLIQPVSTPGQFVAFYGPGSRDQESFYNAFSKEILEAAFNTPSDQLRRLFEGQRNQGGFVKASREQIQALSGRSSRQGQPWPLRPARESQSNRPYNLLNRPLQSNQYGQLYGANPNDYEELQELDVAVSFANITKGAMLGPYYNSRSTKIAMVVNGNGYFEMVCPHLSRQQGQQGREQSGSTYQQVRARVSRGDVLVVPAGHPIVTVASNDQNLEVACFDIKARNNRMYALAGNNNILKQLQRESKELSFNVPARQVEEIFNKQQESWFFPGPEQRQQHGGHPSA